MAVSESEVKTFLRSLLVSAPLKVTVHTLNKDYKELIGENIPFKELGYISLLHFLDSMPDVLSIKGTSPHAEVSLVVSEKINHINNLVMKQKKPSKIKSAQRKSVINNSTINTKAPIYTPRTHNEENLHSETQKKVTSEKLKRIKERVNKSKVLKENLLKIQNKANLQINIKPTMKKQVHRCDKIPQNIQLNLQNLIAKYPQGLSCLELPSVYQKLYKEELDYQKYNFLGLIQLCASMENVFLWEKVSSFDYKLYDKRQKLLRYTINSDDDLCESYTNTPEIDPYSFLPLKSIEWYENSEFVPDDALKLGEQIKPCSANDFVLGQRVPVVVSELCDPGHFFIYKDDGNLESVSNSMQNYYKTNIDNYLIPEFELEKGLYCVVHIFDEFQRCLIVDLLENIGGHVKVYFIDYGTVKTVTRDKIWFLNREFSHLPAQAVRATLSNIQPVEGVWSKRSTLKFRDFVSEKHILAKISMIDERAVAVIISEATSTSKFLNDVLVEEGFATYKDEAVISYEEQLPKKQSAISKLMDRIRAKKTIPQYKDEEFSMKTCSNNF